MLYRPDKYIWDFWFAKAGSDYHVFYLQASRALGDPELRHWNVSIGHAVSQDLSSWETLPDTLEHGEAGTWDDYTTWTGSIVHYAGLWYLFYTGTRRSERGLVQRVGLATSPDLLRWQKDGTNPLIVPNPQWYEVLDLSLWHEQAWRDPWVFQDQETGDFHALITARVNNGPADGRGVIAHARSVDLRRWEVLPPLTEPCGFGHMEVPQLVQIAGRYYLLFCGPLRHDAAADRQEYGGHEGLLGTYYLVADKELGPFHFAPDQCLFADRQGSLYAGKLIQGPSGDWVFMSSYNKDPNGNFIGALNDPLPLQVAEDGKLSVIVPEWSMRQTEG